MVYLRNVTKLRQRLVDPRSGLEHEVEPDGLVRVSEALSKWALEQAPGCWQRVEPIALPAASSNG